MKRKLIFNGGLLSRKRLFIFLAISVFVIFAPQRLSAHQQPTTPVFLDVSPDKVALEMQVSLSELEPDSVTRLRKTLKRWLKD